MYVKFREFHTSGDCHYINIFLLVLGLVKGDEMGRACSTNGGEKECI
jgi:hypothetical protein